LRKKNCQELGEFFQQHFGSDSFIFEKNCITTRFYCPLSAALKGINSVLRQSTFTAHGHPITRGVIRVPKPGDFIWSGQKFSFKSKQQLEKIPPKVNTVAQRLAKVHQLTYKMCTPKIEKPDKKSKILSALRVLKAKVNLSIDKEVFIQALANELPDEADPEFQTVDGTEIDIFWNNLLYVILTQENHVSVGDFLSDNKMQEYKYFEEFNETAVKYIGEKYSMLPLVD